MALPGTGDEDKVSLAAGWRRETIMSRKRIVRELRPGRGTDVANGRAKRNTMSIVRTLGRAVANGDAELFAFAKRVRPFILVVEFKYL